MAQDGSSSSTTCPFSYDVFLSFRGVDTRKNFTDHLYTALVQAGISTFRDDDELERGKNLQPELEKAIKQSAVSIIVFSESYASSTWCLDELLAILESKNKSSNHQIIPVFYKVKPSDVREQEGSFAEAFDEYDRKLQAETNQEKKKTWREKLKAWREELKAWREAFGWYDSQIEAETNQEKNKEWMKKVKAWREALTEAANLTGMVLADRHETKFIKEIVEAVEKKLKLNLGALPVEEPLVGISDIVNRIDSSLRDGSANAAAIHVIYGIGGIGKTTIAKCIYNLHYRNFEASCFLSDVRERSNQPNGLARLQRQLLSAIQKKEKEKIWDVAEGISKVQRAIGEKRVLIVLDDVTEKEQLEALLGPQEFYHGSKIIIATRHMGLLSALRCHPKVHLVETLDHQESLKLFSWHAFRQDHPKKAYIKLSEVIVDHCGGLPLALKVLGSSLYRKSIDVWEETMRKSKEILDNDIQKILQISYESLKREDKDLFLHIACFFTGEDKDYIVTILKHCDLYPEHGIQNLIDRCLLVIDKHHFMQYNKLRMHQLIQEMGREIVRQESLEEPGERSRLWHHEDSFRVLREDTGTTKIKGLVLDMNMLKGDHQVSPLKIDAFGKMKNLKILKLNNVRCLTGSYEKFPERLKFVCWHGFPSKSIPYGIPLENLVILDMSYSKLKLVWKGSKPFNSLKILNLSYSLALIKTPDFTRVPILESLILKGCSSLVEVCESITNLENLVFLDLEDCTSLRNIPGLPTSLVKLIMSNCQNLGGVGQVKWLACLPRFLVTLSIEGCNISNDYFQMDFNPFPLLKCLNISHNSITTLPNCFINLSTLEELYVNCCPNLQSIQGLPTALRLLTTNNNKSLKEVKGVPDTIICFNFYQSFNLNAVEDCLKLIPIDKVDRKIIKNLGIESLTNIDTEIGPIKVLYEFGIFSTFVRGRELPSRFMYKKMGKKISFTVPNNRRIHGLNVCCVIISDELGIGLADFEVSNKTKGFKWIYEASSSVDLFNKRVWLSLWKCGNLLEGEDEVDVEIMSDVSEDEVQCCIDLVYEDEIWEEDRNGEAEIDLSWNDKMRVELSNYNECGKTYRFSTKCPDDYNSYDEDIQYVDWWGLKTRFAEILIDPESGNRLINFALKFDRTRLARRTNYQTTYTMGTLDELYDWESSPLITVRHHYHQG